MSATVEIIIKTVDQTKKGNKSVIEDLKKIGKQFLGITASAAAFGYAVKKAFDMAAQGAAVKQVTASAEALGVNLEALKTASNNTISEFKLLSATQTLLIGTSGELKRAFLDNSAKLLEIAKAANKVNPALGDTSFLYQSIATGIKRSSPLILDNLGLVVKVGEANEEYAKSLGKTVGALTAEERQMALLNATLKAGNVLIDQAGGIADEGVDSFQKLSASIEDATNLIKVGMSVALSEVADSFADAINEMNRQKTIMIELNRLRKEGLITDKEYLAATNMERELNEDLAQDLIERSNLLTLLMNADDDYADILDGVARAQEGVAFTGEHLAGSYRDIIMEAGGALAAMKVTGKEMDSLLQKADPGKLGVFADMLGNIAFVQAGGGALQEFAEGTERLLGEGTIGQTAAEEAATWGYIAEKALAVKMGGMHAWEAAREVVSTTGMDYQEALDYVTDFDAVMKEIDNTHVSVMLEIEAEGDEDVMGVFQGDELLEDMPLEEVQSKIANTADTFQDGFVEPLDNARGILGDIDSALQELNNSHYKIFLDVEVTGDTGAFGTFTGTPEWQGTATSEDEEEGDDFATGGSFIVGGSGAADSQYVGFWASPGEQVTVSTPGQQEKESGTGVVNNYFYGAQINSQDSQMMDILGIRV